MTSFMKSLKYHVIIILRQTKTNMAENKPEDEQELTSEPSTSETVPLLQEQEEQIPPPPFNPSGE